MVTRGNESVTGSVNHKTTLSFGALESVERAPLDCLSLARPGGWPLRASDRSLRSVLPVRNWLRMLEAAKIHGGWLLLQPRQWNDDLRE